MICVLHNSMPSKISRILGNSRVVGDREQMTSLNISKTTPPIAE